MLKTSNINPVIVGALAACGHGDKVLIADGNFPLGTYCSGAQCVYVGIAKGLPTVPAVLETLNGIAAFERAEVMLPEDGAEPPLFADFRRILGSSELDGLSRYEFYAACGESGVKLAISTGESRLYGNILLTVGCA